MEHLTSVVLNKKASVAACACTSTTATAQYSMHAVCTDCVQYALSSCFGVMKLNTTNASPAYF